MPLRMFPVLLLALTLAAAPPPKLAQARSGADLARFIYGLTRAKVAPADLVQGLESRERVEFSETGAIPVAEIYAAAVAARYRRELGEAFPAFGKRLELRTFCAFKGRKGTIYQYPIVVYGESERAVLRELAGRQANQCPLHKQAMVRAEIPVRFGKPKLDPGYSEARERLFSNAREACALAGCAVVWKHKAQVRVCPACDRVRREWLAAHPVTDIRVR